MTQIILIIVGVVIIVLFLMRKTREQVVGICATAIGLDTKKRENKEKIAALLRGKGQLSNAELREALGFSERSVVRYMDELEREGKVEQLGSTGRGVIYRLK